MANLSPGQRNKVKKVENSKKMFVFGNMEELRALETYKIPARMAGKECRIRVDVVQSEIPMLLGKATMARVRMEVDYGNNEVKIAGRMVKAFETTAGYLCIPLHPDMEEKGSMNQTIQQGMKQLTTDKGDNN